MGVYILSEYVYCCGHGTTSWMDAAAAGHLSSVYVVQTGLQCTVELAFVVFVLHFWLMYLLVFIISCILCVSVFEYCILL